MEENLFKYDLQAIFDIPNSFLLCNSDSVKNACTFTNILLDWHTVYVDTCKRWQRRLLKWIRNADRESDAWVKNILCHTMEDELRIDISSDLPDLPQGE